MTLKEISEALDKLASALMTTPCRDRERPGYGCLRRQEERPLTASEKAKGWSRRPYWAYDPGAMCNECAAYWHVTRADALLRDEIRLQGEEAVEAERKAVQQ